MGHTNQRRKKRKAILGPAGCTLHAQLAGKNHQFPQVPTCFGDVAIRKLPISACYMTTVCNYTTLIFPMQTLLPSSLVVLATAGWWPTPCWGTQACRSWLPVELRRAAPYQMMNTTTQPMDWQIMGLHTSTDRAVLVITLNLLHGVGTLFCMCGCIEWVVMPDVCWDYGGSYQIVFLCGNFSHTHFTSLFGVFIIVPFMNTAWTCRVVWSLPFNEVIWLSEDFYMAT